MSSEPFWIYRPEPWLDLDLNPPVPPDGARTQTGDRQSQTGPRQRPPARTHGARPPHQPPDTSGRDRELDTSGESQEDQQCAYDQPPLVSVRSASPQESELADGARSPRLSGRPPILVDRHGEEWRGATSGRESGAVPVRPLEASAAHRPVSQCAATASSQWAWVEFNYRPHAYQAPRNSRDVRPNVGFQRENPPVCRDAAGPNRPIHGSNGHLMDT